MTDSKTLYPFAPADDLLEHIGLPKSRVLLNALSPKNILGNKFGLTSPGEVLEGLVVDADSGTQPKLPGLPGLRS